MRGRNRAWILLPAVILVLVAAGVSVSSFQVELGLMRPGKGERAAVAAVAKARDLSAGVSAQEYSVFSRSLLVAIIARQNAAPANPADVRVDDLLANSLDCLQALREAWQLEVEGLLDPEAYGTITYWNVLHPGLDLEALGPVAPAMVREAARARASEWIEKALKLVN